jgi:hypothetical protein
MKKLLVSPIAAVILAATIGCEGRTSGLLTTGPTGGVRVRVVNALTASQASARTIDFLVDGQVAAVGVGFGAASPYVPMTIGSHRLQIRSTASGTTLIDFTRELSTGAFTLVPAPGLGESGALFIADDPTPSASQARVRVVHAAAAPGPVSVYVTSPTADLASATPVFSTLPFGLASQYVTLPPGTYRVRVTRAGSPGEVLLDTGGVAVGGGAVRTWVLTDAPTGGLPTSLSILSDAN